MAAQNYVSSALREQKAPDRWRFFNMAAISSPEQPPRSSGYADSAVTAAVASGLLQVTGR